MSSYEDLTSLEEALPRVLPYVNGCPNPTALFHLRESAIALTTRTLVWREDLESVPTITGVEQYEIPLPSNTTLVKLLGYAIDGRSDGPSIVNPDHGRDLRTWDLAADVAWTDDRVTFRVAPAPTTSGQSLVLTVALAPSRKATSIPTVIFNHCIDAIAAGAIARITALPKQTFSDLQQTEHHSRIFETEVGRLARQVSKGFGRTRQRVRPFFY